MKKVYLYLILLLFVNTTATFAQSWVDQLKTFRDAVYQRDKETAKQFFTFPVSNPGNDFWGVALDDAKGDTHTHIERLSTKQYPLTEELFMLYFDQIFHKKFITSFLKLKTKELYEKGETATPEISEDKIHFYRMSANYDSHTGEITLSIDGHSEQKDKNGEYLDNGGEYNYIYKFRIIKGFLKFESVYMAG